MWIDGRSTGLPSYPGGKNGAGVYQQIINRMPPHEVYIEPFLGGGAVLRSKQPAALNIGIDLDRRVIASWRSLGSADMASLPEESPDAAMRSQSPKAAMRTYKAELAMLASSGGDGEGRSRIPSAVTAMVDGVCPHADAWRFVCGDATRFLVKYKFTGRELVYCDPPYMHATRGRTDLYRHEMTDIQHLELITLIKRLPCRVMISGYWTAMYAARLQRWNAVTFQTTNRAGKRTTEWLWMNFAEPDELHDYRFLGSNFRQRELIKRKKARWVARLGKLPRLERQALLAAIAEVRV